MEQNNTKNIFFLLCDASQIVSTLQSSLTCWVLLVAVWEEKTSRRIRRGEQHTQQHNKNDKKKESKRRREIVLQSSVILESSRTAIFTSTSESSSRRGLVVSREVLLLILVPAITMRRGFSSECKKSADAIGDEQLGRLRVLRRATKTS
jgi:hypothetical protein